MKIVFGPWSVVRRSLKVIQCEFCIFRTAYANDIGSY